MLVKTVRGFTPPIWHRSRISALHPKVPYNLQNVEQESYQNNRLSTWQRVQKLQQTDWITPRIEKITVRYNGVPGPSQELRMTKGLSTPLDCAQHLSRLLVCRSVLALVDGIPWDMHQPLLSDCQLEFLHFKDSQHDPTLVNRAFWRSAAFLLSATLESAFHSKHQVRTLCIPHVKPESGGFVCDIRFTCTNGTSWEPTTSELRALSTHAQRLASNGLPFEPLSVSLDSAFAHALFADEPIRSQQAREEAVQSNVAPNKLTVYRMGTYIQACSGGPLITSTNLIGRMAVASFRLLGQLQGEQEATSLVYRVQGVAIPTTFLTHFSTFDRLIQWAGEPNQSVSTKPAYVIH